MKLDNKKITQSCNGRFPPVGNVKYQSHHDLISFINIIFFYDRTSTRQNMNNEQFACLRGKQFYNNNIKIKLNTNNNNIAVVN